MAAEVMTAGAGTATDRRLHASALVWRMLTENAVFEVAGERFTAREAAEWWA